MNGPLWLARQIWRDATPLCRWTIAVPLIVAAYLALVLLLAAIQPARVLVWVGERLGRFCPQFWRDHDDTTASHQEKPL